MNSLHILLPHYLAIRYCIGIKGASTSETALQSSSNITPIQRAVQPTDVDQPTDILHDSDSDSDDEDQAEENAAREAREAERTRVLQAAGVLSRNPTRRKAPAPPRPRQEEQHSPVSTPVPADPSPAYTESEVEQNTEDAYDRWIAMQREMPALPET